jgi:16S rRNA (adenine(1408)-N(1))-methyltransferase
MRENSSPSSPPTNKGVILDIGTGDGRFVYQMARKNPEKLYIGIDASSEALVKVSEKIHRNPKHGGAKNVLFLQASAESLPEELENIADEVHIHFPWGSLLRGVLKPDEVVLRSLRRVCKRDALVEIITAIDKARDANELSRLGITDVDDQYIESVLHPKFESAGLQIKEYGLIPPTDWPTLCTSWAAKLKSGGTREARYLIAQAG